MRAPWGAMLLGTVGGGARAPTARADGFGEEIKKGDLGVALIFVAMILSVGRVLFKVI